MKIAIDMDGVLANFIKTFQDEAIAKLYPELKLPENFQPTDFWYSGSGLTKDEAKAAFDYALTIDNLWMKIPAYEENVRAFKNFLKNVRNQDIYIVSHRKDLVTTAARQTQAWLDIHGIKPHSNYLGVITTSSSEAKVDLYKAMEMDYSIDDKTETVEACDRLQGHRAVLLDRPWNQKAMVRCRIYDIAKFFATIIHDISEVANG